MLKILMLKLRWLVVNGALIHHFWDNADFTILKLIWIMRRDLRWPKLTYGFMIWYCIWSFRIATCVLWTVVGNIHEIPLFIFKITILNILMSSIKIFHVKVILCLIRKDRWSKSMRYIVLIDSQFQWVL